MFRKTSYLLGTVLLLSTVAIFAAISLVGIPRLMTSGVTEQDPFAENQPVAPPADTTEDLVEPVVIVPPTAVPTTAATEIPKAVFAPSVSPDEPDAVVELEEVAVADAAAASEEVPVVTSDAVTGYEAEAVDVDVETGEPEPIEEVVETRVRSTATAWFYSSLSDEERWLGWYLAPELMGTVLGRTPSGEWLLVETDDDGVVGWVSAENTEVVSGELRDVSLSNYSVAPWSDQEKPFIDLVSESTAFEAPVAVAQAPTVNSQQSESTIWPTNTPWPTKVATPWPTKTPWPTNTPTSVVVVQPTQVVVQPTRVAPQPTATTAWVPSPTVQPLPTAQPTALPTATTRPPATPTRQPEPVATPVVVASEPEAAPTLPGPVSASNAIAWWHLDRDSVQTGGGAWQFIAVVRVPTSFDYSFDIENRTRTVRTVTNDEGDDYFELTLSGISCGSPFSAELFAYQNGAQMVVQNEFTLEVGSVFINAPC